MVLGSTQSLTEMSNRCISWGKGGWCLRLTLPPSCAVVMKWGNLNFLEPSGPLQACNGTALHLPFYLRFNDAVSRSNYEVSMLSHRIINYKGRGTGQLWLHFKFHHGVLPVGQHKISDASFKITKCLGRNYNSAPYEQNSEASFFVQIYTTSRPSEATN
jgi:hypothetical protein